MNVDTGLEAPRARPLSAGLWTLLSWLRREEHASNESLSSIGSDGTAVSFAFLAPPPPRVRAIGVPFTSVSPPTDSYRKRVHEGNVRRHHDRDLTLRSKYGLYRADNGYDALTLPSTRRSLIENSDKENRERRATSESIERRAAYVPGKRRAPLPPNFTATHPTSLTRRSTSRKRPAPKPPVQVEDELKKTEKQNTSSAPPLMNSKIGHANPLTTHASNECKLEKYNKKDDQAKSTTKNRTEKGFLKLLFESKKRNSTMEAVPERVLPNISELDKQAAAIIESCKLKTLNESGPNGSSSTWFCTRCLRKYDSTMVSCTNCLFAQKNNFNGLVPENKSLHSKPSDVYTQTQNTASPTGVGSSSRCGIEAKEKQKLKEMLKEMKNSLPKRPKHDSIDSITIKNTNETTVTSFETPTLRIGSTISDEVKELKLNPQPTSLNKAGVIDCGSFNTGRNVSGEIKTKPTETVVVTQHVVLVATTTTDSSLGGAPPRDESNKLSKVNDVDSSKTNNIKSNDSSISSDDVNLHTPLKISSLLNPIYVPKSNTENQVRRTLFFSQAEKQTSGITTNVTIPSTSIIATNKSNELEESRKIKITLKDDVKCKEKENQNPKLNLTSLASSTANASNLTQKEPAQMCRLKCKDKVFTPLVTIPPVSNHSSSNNVNVRLTVEQHSRRRELINQLEKSIAKGDEAAAADAAMKLAQLKLSCSVLSFSSQIVGESSKSSLNELRNRPTVSTNQNNLKTPSTAAKVNATVQSMEIVTLNKISKSKDEVTVTKPKLINPTPSSMITTRSQETKENPLNEIKIRRELPKSKGIEEPSTSNLTSKETTNDLRTIEVWVEDREATRGPICLRISRQALMGELRQQAETTLGLASRLQRWIVGRALCTDNKTPLIDLAGPNLDSPFYLCVVESEQTSSLQNKAREQKSDAKNAGDVYSELVQLEQRALILNTETFECDICMEEYSTGKGVVLRECVHTFCTQCLSDLVRHCEEAVISCPAMGCSGILQEREIRALVTPVEYEKWLARGLAAAESGTRNAFHCRTRDCTGWALCDPGVRKFPCPVCKHINCIPCEAIHEAETCEEFRAKQEVAKVPSSQTDEGTQAFLETLISKGEALRCPDCSAVITKKWGCDWVKCSACKTEICWVTRGRRWGPGGRGDTSGGCRCGVDGKRCHPSCAYCH